MITHAHKTSTERDNTGLTRFLTPGQGGERDVPADVKPGSDADIDRDDEDDKIEESDIGGEAAEPSPEGTDPDDGEQMDDNIDDLGRRPDGTTQDQPGAANSHAERNAR